MQDPNTTPSSEPRAQGVLGLVFGRRRRIVVDPRYQRRIAGVATGLVAGGFAAFAGALHLEVAAVRRAVAGDPILTEALDHGLALPTVLLVAFGVVLCISVFVLMLVETHRTAGAALSLRRTLLAMAEGRYGARAELRRGDHMGELKLAMDELGQSLARRGELDAQALEALAERLEAAKDAGDATTLAGEVRDLAQRSRERLSG